MNKKNALMYCGRTEKDGGSLYRTLGLAAELSETMDVTIFLDENTRVPGDLPDAIDLVYLAPLSADPDSSASEFIGSEQLRESIIRRRDVILKVFEERKPRVVVVDGFPFKQHLLRGEVLPMIERAHNGIYGESLVVSTTDSIVVDDSANGEDRADRAVALLDKYFSHVIVQSDPAFARLEEFFKPHSAPHIPLNHTGFVSAKRNGQWVADRGGHILVSAGDGRYGGALFRAAIEAHRILWPVSGLSTKIVAGPHLSEDEYWGLVNRAGGLQGIEVARVVDNLRAEMSRARCSVSQCDYETAVDTIMTQTPALFVPCQQGERGEQTVRAHRLVNWGAGRLLLPRHLNAASLANEINQLLHLQPRKIHFDMDGAANAAALIEKAMYSDAVGIGSSRLQTDGRKLS